MCSTCSWCHQSGLYAVSHLPNVQRPAHGPPTKQCRWLPDAEACAELSHWTSAKLSVEDLSLRRVARKDSPKSSVDSSYKTTNGRHLAPEAVLSNWATPLACCCFSHCLLVNADEAEVKIVWKPSLKMATYKRGALLRAPLIHMKGS